MRREKQTKVFEPEVINQAIDYSMGLPTLSKVSLSERASPRGLITTKASMKRMMSALKIFSMVQARKETPDHVSVQEECLNSSCPKEFSLVGINSAILKTKNFGRGICKLIFFTKRVKGITVFTYRFYQRLSKKYQSLACVVALMRGRLFPLYLSKLPITR